MLLFARQSAREGRKHFDAVRFLNTEARKLKLKKGAEFTDAGAAGEYGNRLCNRTPQHRDSFLRITANVFHCLGGFKLRKKYSFREKRRVSSNGLRNSYRSVAFLFYGGQELLLPQIILPPLIALLFQMDAVFADMFR